MAELEESDLTSAFSSNGPTITSYWSVGSSGYSDFDSKRLVSSGLWVGVSSRYFS